MATRLSREARADRPRRRWARFGLTMLVVLGPLVWFAPRAVVLTALRDQPLAAIFAGIDGSVGSSAAVWRWWGGIEYRDVVLRDRQGRALVAVPRVVIDRGLAALAIQPGALGVVRLIGGEALVEVRRGGSTIEDVLAPWLAARASSGRSLPVSFDLEVVDAAVELVDLDRRDAWRITDVIAAGTVRSDATLAGWTVSGRVRPTAEPSRDLASAANRVASEQVRESAGPLPTEPGGRQRADPPVQFDRTTVAAGATAMLARDGGWSVSSQEMQRADQPRSLSLAATRLPLGVLGIAATRFDTSYVPEGLADLRLDVTLPGVWAAARPERALPPADGPPAASGTKVAGVVAVTGLAVRDAAGLPPLLVLDRGEMPIDLSIDGDRVTVRTLKIASPLFKAEASGRMHLPRGSIWDWAELAVGEDFAIAADIDLAALSRALPGGLTVRPDVRVTGGTVQFTAVTRPDGLDRVLEVRAGSRDVAAVQSGARARSGGGSVGGANAERSADGGERLLRWSEPFTAWVRGRRGAGRGERLRIEEARIASPALEVAAAGTVEASALQWTLDLGRLLAEAGEVLELEGLKLAGTARGRLDMEQVPATGGVLVKATASLANLEVSRPGRPPWRDAELALEAEGSGGLAGAAFVVDQGRAVVTAASDVLELSLSGGVLVNPWSLLPGMALSSTAWLRAAPTAQAIVVDASLVGELARWQPRAAVVCGGGVFGDAALEGFAKVTASLAAAGDAWQITRAGGEVEKLAITIGDRQIREPRAVVTAAGRWHPGTATIDVSSAELLTPTLSLRTGGLRMLPVKAAGGAAAVVERFRGRLQWQADVSRLEHWLLAADAAARWPAGGRIWGTAEVLDTPIGLNVLVDATGSQLSLAGPPSPLAVADGKAVPVWSEPRAALTLELTCPLADAGQRMTVNQFKLDSSTLAIAAAGSVLDPAARRLVDLGGNLAYDWEQVSRLVTPWTGGAVRLSGAGARPFTLRGPLGRIAADATAAAAAAAGPLPLPPDWLAGRRGDAVDPPERLARVAASLPPAARQADGLADRVRAVAIDTSAAWNTAEIAGFELAGGEMPVRLFEGQLALGPFDLAASGGRLRGAPWVKLLPGPVEVIVPPGRCLDRVVLSPQLCDRWVTWLVPLIGHSTHTQGLVSIDLAGARLPVADPLAGEASGQVLFENLEATPGEQVRPLVNLIVKLQSAIDPRFAFGDKTVLMRVRPEPIAIRVADRRVWHDGLVMDSGQLVIRSRGSVGEDGSLAMVVEIAFRGDIAGATPVVGQLLRTPLAIPLKGTVRRPQFDARSLDVIVARIMENTSEALFGPKLSRDLETLFGNPPPVEPPLSLPGSPR